MMKFLRKYNKWILAVGGTLLMIVFLIPQAVQNLGQQAAQGSATVAISDGERISAKEWEPYLNEMRVLVRLQATIPQLLGPFVLSIREPEHWYLMVREAEAAGLVGGEELGTQAAVALQTMSGLTQDRETIARTLAKIDGINRLLNLYQQAGKFSDIRLVESAREEFLSMTADLVVLQADPEAVEYEPTEEELQAHLDKYGPLTPAESETGFGYRVPDRVQIEYLGVDVDSVRTMVETSGALDPVSLHRHWIENADDPTLNFPPVNPNIDVPSVVREHLLTELTRGKLDDIARFMNTELRKASRSLVRDEAQFFELPDDWDQQRVSFPDLAQRVQDEFGIATPIYERPADWLTFQDLSTLGDVSQAYSTRYGQNPIRLPQLVMGTRELDNDSIPLIQEGVATAALRLPADGRPVSAATINQAREQPQAVFVVRVLATSPAHAPASVDEVRDDLVQDLKRMRHFEQMTEQIDALQQEARDKGMLSFALDHDTTLSNMTEIALHNNFQLQQAIRQQQPIRRFAGMIPGLGFNNEAAVEAMLEQARTLPDGPVGQMPESQRIFAVPLENDRAVVVFRVFRLKPVTEELYQDVAANSSLQNLIAATELELGQAVFDAFSAETLRTRHGFEFVDRGDEEEELDGETEPADDAESDVATASAG